MNDVFWEVVKSYIPTHLRPKALNDLEQAGMEKYVKLPGLGKAERSGRNITSDKGKEYNLTPAQVSIIINIASEYPNTCAHRQALRGVRSGHGAIDKGYLRVVLSKIKSIYPEFKDYIKCEKWSGYRWMGKLE